MIYTDTFHRIAYTVLRFSLAAIFLWFGILKLLNLSPVYDLIFAVYPVIAQSSALLFLLAVFEVVIGIGILIPRVSTTMLWIMIAHLLTVTIGVLVSPYAFVFDFPFLSLWGEFVVKNLAMIGGALVLISHDASLKS